MQYMLLVYLKEDGPTEAQREKCYQESAAFTRSLAEEGKYILTAPLHPTSTATSVRAVDGRRLVTDGPFAETREQLGGFLLINVQDLDEAIDIAKRFPAGQWGTVEIRPVMEISGRPASPNVDFAISHPTH